MTKKHDYNSPRDDDLAALAVMDIQPLELDVGLKMVPAPNGPQCTAMWFAAHCLAKSKPELVEVARRLFGHKTDESHAFDALLQEIRETREWLKACEKASHDRRVQTTRSACRKRDGKLRKALTTQNAGNTNRTHCQASKAEFQKSVF